MKKFVLISDVLKYADYAYDLADPEIVIGDSEGYYGENTKNRVSMIPNRGKIPGYNLSKDAGNWAAAGISNCPGPLPGPVFIPESARFNKRPACFFDYMGVALDSFWGVPAHALLTVPANPINSDDYMNAPHGHKKPFDVVVMNRPYCTDGKQFPPSQSAIDTFEPEGGPTIARGIEQHDNKFWTMTTGLPQNGHLWPATTIELDENMTILFVARFDGSNSFLELNWRDASGVLQTNRTPMTISNIGTLTNFYVGATGSSYTSALAIKLGALSENDIDSLREWGSEYLPPLA